MSKKVLLIGMTPNPGGVETYILDIFSLLQGHGFQFYFINIFNNKLAYENYIKAHNGIIFNIQMKQNGLLKYFINFYRAKKFFKHHNNYDIIHINALSSNDVYWAKAAKMCGINNVIFQSHESSTLNKSILMTILSNLSHMFSRCYLHTHRIMKLAASYKCGTWMFGKNSNFKVIYNGVDTNLFYPSNKARKLIKQNLRIKSNYKVIITVARFNQQKNYHKIINVFYYMHKINPLTKLVTIGSGEKLKGIKKQVKRLGLVKSVYFLGLQSKSNVIRLLNIGDLMLMPSYFEGMPFSLIEAQSMGLPALVSLGVPYSANITHHVTYLSLDKSDYIWAKTGLKIISDNSYIFKDREHMNSKVNESKFSLSYLSSQIRQCYNSL